MLSETQFEASLTFLKSYKDALACVEQIAERRQSYAHYERQSASLVSGLEKNQVSSSFGWITLTFIRSKLMVETWWLVIKLKASLSQRHMHTLTHYGKTKVSIKPKVGQIWYPNSTKQSPISTRQSKFERENSHQHR